MVISLKNRYKILTSFFHCEIRIGSEEHLLDQSLLAPSVCDCWNSLQCCLEKVWCNIGSEQPAAFHKPERSGAVLAQA